MKKESRKFLRFKHDCTIFHKLRPFIPTKIKHFAVSVFSLGNFLTFRQIPSILNLINPPKILVKYNLLKLTNLDHQLIRCLNRNARLSSAELARELGFSERTIRNRIQRLIQEGILKPVAVINSAAFGYTLVVDIFCEIEVSRRDEVIAAIKMLPEVSYMAISTGEQDVSFQALFKNSADMHEFITQRVYTIPGIRRTRTVLVPQIVKDTYQWLPPEDGFTS